MAKKPAYSLARLFLALSNQTRLDLLNLLSQGEVCVCHLVETLGLPQPKISQHLACLRSVGLVQARREGKWMHYRLAPEPAEESEKILRATLKSMKNDRQLRAGREKLVRIRCAPRD